MENVYTGEITRIPARDSFVILPLLTKFFIWIFSGGDFNRDWNYLEDFSMGWGDLTWKKFSI